MKLNYYRSEGRNDTPDERLPITTIRHDSRFADDKGAGNSVAGKRDYIPHPDLADAVNVALALGRPLLLTGEPGTGKTELAYDVAHSLGLAGPFKFVAKSTSQYRDLFYTYDALDRFYAVQSSPKDDNQRERAKDILNFITYTGLGKAILLAHKKKTIAKLGLLPPEPDKLRDDQHKTYKNRDGEAFVHPGRPQRAVVLIDEIDKAPRDFTNDLLDEIDRMRFLIPELQNELTPALTGDTLKNYWPLVIITSNEEKNLPDPFLRRCLYHHIEFPKRQKDVGDDGHNYNIEAIVAARLGSDFLPKEALLNRAIKIFYTLRDKVIGHKPATAELLDWLLALKAAGGDEELGAGPQDDILLSTNCALLKNVSERQQNSEVFKAALKETGKKDG